MSDIFPHKSAVVEKMYCCPFSTDISDTQTVELKDTMFCTKDVRTTSFLDTFRQIPMELRGKFQWFLLLICSSSVV